MIIKLYEIEESISVKGSLDASRFKRPEDADIVFSSAIGYELTVRKAGDGIWVSGPVHADLSLTCDRCLEQFAFSVTSRLDIELLPKPPHAPGAAEVELKTEEMNVYYFEGDEIDLDPYVFEEVMLNMPIKTLCSESCRGMCPGCGVNLNVEACRCEKKESTVLGDKLKSFLKDR
jgi:uncharacterized protein